MANFNIKDIYICNNFECIYCKKEAKCLLIDIDPYCAEYVCFDCINKIISEVK